MQAFERWIHRIPQVYRESILHEASESNLIPDTDPCCLATLKHYRSLIPMAQEARKPIFSLTVADGAIGAHSTAVRNAYGDFRQLAARILGRMK